MLGAFNRFYVAAIALPILAGGLMSSAVAEPVPRSGPPAGAVIARKIGEEVRFIDVSSWQSVDLKQDLLTGDVLRTNATGQLAILFSDRTQVRLGRNSSLVVKQITASTSADTVLQLQSGTIWARAERGGPGVRVETPAAAAAIRGTDWTMTVKGDQTSLNVIEGVVQLSNPQGSVDVRQGEGAVASIGQAPRKIVIVDSDDREQMLFFLPPREAFERMPPSAQPVAEMRRNADRIAAIPPERRSAEDWVALAEAQLSLEGRQRARQTLATLSGHRLTASQQARVTLIEAVLEASETRYSEAARLFEKAQRGLDPKRRGIALYGGYYARALADPNRVEALPPQAGGSDGAFLRAYALGFLQDLGAAIKVLKEAERQYPDDPELPAYRGWLAILLNDRAQAEEALNRSLSIDPAEPTALEARSHFRAGFKGDYQGALADLEAAIKVAPGSSTTWNAIGNIQAARNANREAEAAFRKSIELDPQDPLAHSNLAIFYLDIGRIGDAKREIDKALAIDPGFDTALVARGRYYLQTGELDKAVDDLLAASVANPGYSQAQLLLAAANYEKGDRLPAEQATENAERLDDNDPVISALRTAVAIDNYDSEGAIRNAQEYLRRSKARGGDFTSLGANQQAGSTLNDAFRLQGMNAWGEYYSDAAFDPFAGTAYIDQSIRGSANPFVNNYFYGDDVITNTPNGQAFSSFLQGLMLEPHIISGRSRSANIIRRPFFEGSIGGGINTAGGELDFIGEGDIQGYSNLPFPISFYGNLQWQEVPDSRDIGALTDLDTENKIIGGNGYLTASPTAHDRLVLYYNTSERDSEFAFQRLFVFPDTVQRSNTDRLTNGGIGWSHTVEHENVINAALLFNRMDSRSHRTEVLDLFGTPFEILSATSQFEQDSYIAALNHTVGTGNFTWRYGGEAGWLDSYQSQDTFDVLSGAASASSSSHIGIGLIYVDLLHEINPDLKAEYGLFGTLLSGDGVDIQRLDPRVGIAWSPANGQWLRAGFIRSSVDLSTPTLSPIGIVGLQPNQISTDPEGFTNTMALRWDAEWTPDFYTALEFQHQDVKNPQIGIPLSAIPFTTSKGRIDRGSLSGNLLLGHGFGLSSTVAYTASEDRDPASATFGGPLPFLPEWAGQVALTWVNDANVKATLAANYVGDRVDEVGIELDDYWTLDASLTWEPFDKRFELDLTAYNLLDEDIEVSAGTPGWGRSFRGTLKVRF
ncbi:FecR domain-containing protein [Neorhizobium galegae]|uniref:FecR domain-containing protein n=1 Tax=Neorhizobium galegae TaxID=399 RepID=UPI00127C2C3A|nr:FecR domain-containing protein [Neorhizobium galegae]KAA9383632.1 tetratricopeptide repeat protein [Neorhizobium galegae]KAB1111903.1 tetratricopeptide repeat protein [Neorhizobium galegae]